MKSFLSTTCIAAFIFVGITNVNGQNARVLFDSACKLYENDSVEPALNLFIKITKEYPKDSNYPRAFYNVGYLAWSLKKYDTAKNVFFKILDSKFDDNEKGPGEGIMSEPYALYKHRACAMLSGTFLDNKDFKNALKYLKLSDKKYPYRHFCGNELAENGIYTDIQYSKCYEGLNQIDKAINVLLPDVFDYGLANNSETLEQLKIVLPKKYDREQIVSNLNTAVNTVKIKMDKQDTSGYVTIFGNAIILPDRINEPQEMEDKISYDEYTKMSPIEQYKSIYTNSEFYKAFVSGAKAQN